MRSKDFTNSRAAGRVRRVSEEEAVFGGGPKPAAEGAQVIGGNEAATLTRSMKVLVSDDLYYRMKAYLARRDRKWNSAGAMVRDLLETELDKHGA